MDATKIPMGDEQNIYVDASQPATLNDGPVHTDCPTLQEAVLAWHRLPPVRQQTATINSSGQVYTVREIDRLHYGPASDSVVNLPRTNNVDIVDVPPLGPLEKPRGIPLAMAGRSVGGLAVQGRATLSVTF
jgi:hypothetical protein